MCSRKYTQVFNTLRGEMMCLRISLVEIQNGCKLVIINELLNARRETCY